MPALGLCGFRPFAAASRGRTRRAALGLSQGRPLGRESRGLREGKTVQIVIELGSTVAL